MIPWFETPVLHFAGTSIDVPSALAVAGLLVAMASARRQARRAGLSPRRALDDLALMLVSGLCFGRLLETVYYPEYLPADWQLLLPWRGGYCSLGVFLGIGIVLGILFHTRERCLFWRHLDAVTGPALLGGAIVRLGCFLGHHHAGRLTTSPLAVVFPGGARYDLGLCESLLLFALSAAYLVCERPWRSHPGRCAVLSATAYAVGRFGIELLRGHDLESIGRRSDARYWGLTLVQYATAALAGAGLVWLWRQRASAPSRHQPSS